MLISGYMLGKYSKKVEYDILRFLHDKENVREDEIYKYISGRCFNDKGYNAYEEYRFPPEKGFINSYQIISSEEDLLRSELIRSFKDCGFMNYYISNKGSQCVERCIQGGYEDEELLGHYQALMQEHILSLAYEYETIMFVDMVDIFTKDKHGKPLYGTYKYNHVTNWRLSSAFDGLYLMDLVRIVDENSNEFRITDNGVKFVESFEITTPEEI